MAAGETDRSTELVAKARHVVTHATDLTNCAAGGVAAGVTHGGNGGHLGVGGQPSTIAAALPIGAPRAHLPMGRAAALLSGTKRVLDAVGRAGQGRWPVGAVADPRRAGATVGTARGRPVVWRPLARHGAKVAPDTRHPKAIRGAEVEKTPEILAAVVNPAGAGSLGAAVVQDEARFGHGAPVRAPLLRRPVMLKLAEPHRVHGAVSPLQATWIG
jgi:hypothetical protein